MAAGHVLWSGEAERVGQRMPGEARAELQQQLDYLRELPRMYPVAQDERYPGCRTFFLEPNYRIFYMVSPNRNDIVLAAIEEEELELPAEWES